MVTQISYMLGERISIVRNYLGISRADVAALWDIGIETVGRIESGRIMVSADKLIMLHDEYGVNINYILFKELPIIEDTNKYSNVVIAKELEQIRRELSIIREQQNIYNNN